jgi:SH3-like domain-containing protein
LSLPCRLAAVLLACGLCLAPAAAAEVGPANAPTVGRETGLPVPRFATLRSGEVNLRAGPGLRYPVQWVYKRRGLPVEITAEFDAWRRILDHTGTIGWIHRSMLSGRRTVLVTGEMRTLYSDPDGSSRPLARLETGTIGALQHCRDLWCAVEFAGIDGWLRRGDVFGLLPGEDVP